MNHSLQISYPRLLLEVVLIVGGVLLGLFVNEARLERRNGQRAEAAVEKIVDEMRTNQKHVETIAPYHAAMSDSLQVGLGMILSGSGEFGVPQLQLAMPQGFKVASLSRNAWDLAGTLGLLEFVDYEVASMLSRTYDLQDFYMGKYDHVMGNFYSAGNADPSVRSGLVLALAMVTNDISHHENDLLEMYEQAIEIAAPEQ